MELKTVPDQAVVMKQRAAHREEVAASTAANTPKPVGPLANGWLIQDGIVKARVVDHAPDPAFLAESAITADVVVGQALPWPRTYRDQLLAACDWTQVADAKPPGGVVAWAAYRQALRDLPGRQFNAAAMYVAAAWPALPA